MLSTLPDGDYFKFSAKHGIKTVHCRKKGGILLYSLLEKVGILPCLWTQTASDYRNMKCCCKSLLNFTRLTLPEGEHFF